MNISASIGQQTNAKLFEYLFEKLLQPKKPKCKSYYIKIIVRVLIKI